MLNLTRLHLGIAHESQFQGLGIKSVARLKWQHLPINICVARNRSFLAAALELGMSPSAISHAVRNVEGPTDHSIMCGTNHNRKA